MNVLAWLVGGAIVAASLTGLALWRVQGDKLLSVQTGSMVPVLKRGDAVAIVKVDPKTLQAGEIVSYLSPVNSAVTVTHRVVRLDLKHGVVITKGDALAQPDPPVPLDLVLGRVRAQVPKIGFAINELHKPIGLVAGVYLPALGMVVFEVRHLARAYRRRHYRLYGYV